MPYFAEFFNCLSKLLNWAAACFVLMLLYTLVQDSIVENTPNTDGGTGTFTTQYRYPISFENQGIASNNRTIQRNKSVHQMNTDNAREIMNNTGRGYSSDQVHSLKFKNNRQVEHSNRVKDRPRVPSDALQQFPNLLKLENKLSLKSGTELPSSSNRWKSNTKRGSRAQKLHGNDGSDSRSSQKISVESETNKDPDLTDPNFYSGNFSVVEESSNDLNRTDVSLENSEQDKNLSANVIERLQVSGELYSAEEAINFQKYVGATKVNSTLNSNTLHMKNRNYNDRIQVSDHSYPTSTSGKMHNSSEDNEQKLIRYELSQPVLTKSTVNDAYRDETNENKKAHVKYIQVSKENKKLEFQVENTAKESPSKVLLPAFIAKDNVGDKEKTLSPTYRFTDYRFINKTSSFNGKQASFFPWLLRKSKVAVFQRDEERGDRSNTEGVIGDDLLTTACEDDEDCVLSNYNLAAANTALAQPATCNKLNDSANGTCTCRDFCVSRSYLYSSSESFYYCGPCGRVGSSCTSDDSCNQTVSCTNSYCSCSRGDFYELYYCIYKFTGYEKALQVAISICIAVAIFLLVVTLCGARHRARGGEELSPYLMRLLLRRANEGTRESPEGDIPPSYEDVIAADCEQLPSYEDAMQASDLPSDLLHGLQPDLPLDQQDDLPVGEVNYGFHMDEEGMENIDNTAGDNFIRNLQPVGAVQELKTEYNVQISETPSPDVKISIAEVNEGFENDEFNQIYDLCTDRKNDKELSDNGAALYEVVHMTEREPAVTDSQDSSDKKTACDYYEKRHAQADNPNVINDGFPNSMSYIQMDPSTGAIPKHRSRQMQEHLSKLQRGPNRKLQKKKESQNGLFLQNSSNPNTVHPMSSEPNENSILKSDSYLSTQTEKSLNSSVSLETCTPISNDGQQTSHENANGLTRLNKVLTHSSAVEDIGKTKPESSESKL